MAKNSPPWGCVMYCERPGSPRSPPLCWAPASSVPVPLSAANQMAVQKVGCCWCWVLVSAARSAWDQGPAPPTCLEKKKYNTHNGQAPFCSWPTWSPWQQDWLTVAYRPSSYFRNCKIIYENREMLIENSMANFDIILLTLCMLWICKALEKQLDRTRTIKTIPRSLYLTKLITRY